MRTRIKVVDVVASLKISGLDRLCDIVRFVDADPPIDRLLPAANAPAFANAIVDSLLAPSRLPRRFAPATLSDAGRRFDQVFACAIGRRPMQPSGRLTAAPADVYGGADEPTPCADHRRPALKWKLPVQREVV